MIENDELAIRLFGEARERPSRQTLAVGPMSCTIEGMAIRWIEYRGIEVLRGIAFVVRDRNWGTYQSPVTMARVAERPDRILVRLTSRIAETTATLECAVEVLLTPNGVSVSTRAISHGVFYTNRTGLVVLHPPGCAGVPIRVEHASGGATTAEFPRLVSPHQPFRSITAIEHEAVADLAVRVAFSGDIFEMEDHRNWSDASFKTYSRPLALPYPYMIGSGETVAQTVTVAVTERTGTRRTARCALPRIELTDQPAARLPRLGLGGRARDYAGTQIQLDRLAQVRPALLLLEAEAPDRTGLAAFRAALEATGAEAAIMLRADRASLADWRDCLAGAGVQPREVALVTTDPAMVAAARQAFPGARIGAGTDAFFAEFNRNSPPAADFLFWTVNPTVHAIDDTSVMETLSVLGHQAETARARHPDAALWCGPVTLRMRFNPNQTGPAVPEPPGVPPADVDARQRGLFAAAFTLGHIAAWSDAGAETLLLYAPFGPRGVIYADAGFPQAWFNDAGEGAVYPAFHVLSGLSSQSGRALRGVRNDAPDRVIALAATDALWVANRGTEAIEVQVPGTGAQLLDDASFAHATIRPDGFWNRDPAPIPDGVLKLGPYAVARVSLPQ